jgi:hypothetical protein
MTLIEDASSAIRNLHELTSGFGSGGTPDPLSVLGYQSKIVELHSKLGQEMSRKFGGKESAYLTRKIAEAKMYRQGRKELKTVADSSQEALTFVENDMIRENQAAEEYESYRLMLQSLDKAFQHSMQTVSFLGKAESRSSSNQQ